MLKKIVIMVLLISMISGCTSSQKTSNQNKTEENTVHTEGKILIAYFSWADNTIVEDEEGSINSALEHYESVGDHGDYVDAVSSASILQPGNVSQMAGWIQASIGGDLFTIQVTDPYPSDYDECLERAADEKSENARPELESEVENIEDYSTVFIGYPNWWYSVPMPVLTFIEENDLSDKKVVLFCSHGTGGLARSVEDIQHELPDSVYLEENVIGIYRDDINDSQDEIEEWLNEIGY